MTDSAAQSRLYASPEVYDVAFGWDLKLELDFLDRCFAEHVEGPVRRVLEPACGTGRLLLALAERGYDVAGYDRSAEMTAYAAARLAPHEGAVWRGDMTTFRPPGEFDAALNLVNSIGYLLEDEEVVAHLSRVAEAVRPGGIYLVQVSYEDEPPELASFGPWGNRRGDLSTTLFWRVVREDKAARRSHQECRITARRGRERTVFEESHVLRLWSQEDFDRLVQATPFRLAAVYHDCFEPFDPEERRTGEYGNLYHVLRRD
jgi:SAM-dependent methyltransferase